jgi:hypothetical protein
MNLSSLSSQFVFNLPPDFVSQKVKEKYKKMLRKNHIPYDDVLDYLNSTITEVVFPSMSYITPEQTMYHGKQIQWKGAQNVYDTFVRELDIVFDSVNSHLNYFILVDILVEEYLDTDNNYSPDLSVTILDKHGDAIYDVLFRSVNIKSLSETRLNFSDQVVDQKTFTMSFIYNYIDIKYNLDGEDIITDGPTQL